MTIPLSLSRKPLGLYRATLIDKQMCILLLSSATAVATPLLVGLGGGIGGIFGVML